MPEVQANIVPYKAAMGKAAVDGDDHVPAANIYVQWW